MSAPLRIRLAGECDGLAELRATLRLEPGIELTDSGDADAVLLATPGQAVPAGELAALRRQISGPVILLAAHPSAALLDEALAHGIGDVQTLPQPAESLFFAIHKAIRAAQGGTAPRREASGRILTVFSPKGGTGKSVTSCNLAAAVAGPQRRTLLLDLDLQFGDVAIMLGLEPRSTLHDLVSAPGELDEEKLQGYVTPYAPGLHVLPAPLRPDEAESVPEARVVQLLDVARRVYDVIVVDTSPYFHGPMLSTLDRTDELLLVCTPDVPTLKNVRLTLKTLELLEYPEEQVRVLLNRVDDRLGLRARDVAAVLGRAIDFRLPSDQAVPLSVNRGTPAVSLAGRGPYAKAVQAMAAELLGGGGVVDEPVRASRRFVPRLALGRA